MLKRDFRIKVLIIFTFLYSIIIVSGQIDELENLEFGPKIVGGHEVNLRRYPFAIQFFNLGALCGGVILNSWSVLTAAHCLQNNQDLNEMVVQIGSKYIYDFSATKHKLRSFVVHENYNKKIPFENDIAILFVDEPMKFNKVTKKAILVNHNKWMDVKQKRFVVTGWGWQKYGGSLSEMSLMMAHLSYVPTKVCSMLHNLELSDDMFCLYGDGQRDTCRGDSGGGVTWNGMLVGLTSHGDGCAKVAKPSVYTNLWHQRGWITEQVHNFINSFCETSTS